MLTYIAAFIFYTMAMIGVMLVAFVVYKKTWQPNKSANKNMIKVIDSISIGPKKQLLVVRVKNEKFLIASDAERTSFLSKLSDDNQKASKEIMNEVQQMQQNQRDEELQQEKFNKIQNQFRQLYSSQEHEPIMQTPDRKEMIRKLLKDLNETAGMKTGSDY